MTAPANLDFETAGAAPGSAASWFIGAGHNDASPLKSAWVSAAFAPLAPIGNPSADPAAVVEVPNDFDPTVSGGKWTAPGGAVTVDTNATTAPDGTATADRARASAVLTTHRIDEWTSRSFLAGVTYTFGAFFQRNGASSMPSLGPRIDFGGGNIIGVSSGGTNLGAVGAISATAITPVPPVARVSAETFDMGTGWVCTALSFVLSFPASAKLSFAFGAGGNETFTGDLTGHYLWGAFAYAGELTPREDFEGGWGTTASPYLFALTLGTSSLSAVWQDNTVVTRSAEAFEGGWNNTPNLTTLDASLTTSVVWDAGFSNGDVDTFIYFEGWDSSWSDILIESFNATACAFDAAGVNQTFESFAATAHWDATYATTIAGGVAFATQLSDDFEGFSPGFRDVLCVPDPATDAFTANAHGLINTSPVVVVNVGGSFPTPLVRTLLYYVANVTANTFKLSLSSGGAAIDITDFGTGDLYVRASGAWYWWGPDFNPTI